MSEHRLDLNGVPFTGMCGRGTFLYLPEDEARLREYLECHNPPGVCKEHGGL